MPHAHGGIPAATLDTFDLASALRDREDIRAKRTTTAIRESALSQDRDTKVERRRYLEGDDSAMSRLIAIDPAAGQELLEAIDAMDKGERDTYQQRAEETGQLAVYVLQGATDGEQRQRWNQVLEMVDPKVREALPTEFNAEWLQFQLSRQTAAADYLERIADRDDATTKFGRDMDLVEARGENALAGVAARREAGIAGTEARGREARLTEADKATNRTSLEDLRTAGRIEVVEARGRVTITVNRERNAASGTETGIGGGTIKTADANAIYRATAANFNGTFDNGRISFGDTDTAEKALAVAARAEAIFAEGSMGPAEAVRRAMAELGGGDESGGDPNDPLGIR